MCRVFFLSLAWNYSAKTLFSKFLESAPFLPTAFVVMLYLCTRVRLICHSPRSALGLRTLQVDAVPLPSYRNTHSLCCVVLWVLTNPCNRVWTSPVPYGKTATEKSLTNAFWRNYAPKLVKNRRGNSGGSKPSSTQVARICLAENEKIKKSKKI